MKEHGRYMYEAVGDGINQVFQYAIYSYKQGPRCRFKRNTLMSDNYFLSESEAENKALERIKSWDESTDSQAWMDW